MSYAIMRLEKRNSNNIVGMFKHNERKTENHSNEDINKDLSHLNYQLIECDSYKDKINQEIKDRYKVNKSIRKDAVLCVEVLFTSDKEFFDKLTPEQEKKYFEKSVEFLKEQFGEKNVVFATVHKDETTPHLHAGFIPLTDDGRLNYKNFVNGREGLIKLQNEYFEKMSKEFPELERGQNAKETRAKHIANQEYKFQEKEKTVKLKLEDIEKASKELEQQEKKISKRKKELTREDEHLYKIENLIKHVIENKGFFKKDITMTMSDEVYKSLLKFAREGEKYLSQALELVDINKKLSEKIENLSTEKEVLEKENKELKNDRKKYKNLEKLREWLPVEIIEKFEEYQKQLEKEKSITRDKTNGLWSNKIKNDKDNEIEL